MKVLLIRPRSLNIVANTNIIDLEPLNLEYLYTICNEENVQSMIFDGLHDKRRLVEVLKEFNPDMAAITGYITQEPVMIEYSRIIKQYNPSIDVMVGGVHAEVNYQRFYCDTIDYIVHTSSLQPFKEILRYLTDINKDAGCGTDKSKTIRCSTDISKTIKSSRDISKTIRSSSDRTISSSRDIIETNLKNIAGICYRSNAGWVKNSDLGINPNDLPIPDRTFFNDNKHLYRYLGFEPCAVVKTAFSCPYQCSFCYCREINSGKYTVRDIELVVDEIEGIECDTIHIVDDTFLVDSKRVNSFIALIKNRKINKNFIFYSRADFIVAHEDTIKKLGEIGTKAIIVGLEAIDDSVLKSYSKQSSEDINEKCVTVLHKYNIDCIGLFIVGIDAVKEDFKRLYRWAEKMNLKYATVSIFTPIHGTTVFDDYKDRLITNKIQNWDFLHLVLKPTKMTKAAFYLEFYKLSAKLITLGKKHGAYEFVNGKYLINIARTYILNLFRGAKL